MHYNCGLLFIVLLSYCVVTLTCVWHIFLHWQCIWKGNYTFLRYGSHGILQFISINIAATFCNLVPSSSTWLGLFFLSFFTECMCVLADCVCTVCLFMDTTGCLNFLRDEKSIILSYFILTQSNFHKCSTKDTRIFYCQMHKTTGSKVGWMWGTELKGMVYVGAHSYTVPVCPSKPCRLHQWKTAELFK